MTQEQLIAISAAALLNMVIGFVWYSPKVFGTAWMKMTSITPLRAPGTGRMAFYTVLGFFGSLISAYVLLYFGIAWGVYDWASAIELAFWVWLGFEIPIVLGGVLWEMKPWKWLTLNGAYYLLAAIVMSLTILSISGFSQWY